MYWHKIVFSLGFLIAGPTGHFSQGKHAKWKEQQRPVSQAAGGLGGGNSKILEDFHPDPWGFMIQFDEP